MDTAAAETSWQELPDTGQHLPAHRGFHAPQSQAIRQLAALARKLRRRVRRHEDRQMNPLWDAVMETPTYIALSRQMTLRSQMDVVANNIANANTPGFKAEMLLMSEVELPSDPTTELSYVQDFATARDFSPGALRPTGNDLDLAIQGNGFFAVQTPEGTRYTRVGRFELSGDGTLVTSQGYPVLSGGSAVTLNPDDGPVNVAEDGSISTDRARNGQQQQVVGKLDVVDFQNRAALTPAQDNLFDAGTEAPIAATGKVAQRMLEDSNVNSIVEMTNMIEVTRNYQAVQRFLDAENDRQRRAINSITSNS
jgi:flagellar basal-body rod protein FlgF